MSFLSWDAEHHFPKDLKFLSTPCSCQGPIWNKWALFTTREGHQSKPPCMEGWLVSLFRLDHEATEICLTSTDHEVTETCKHPYGSRVAVSPRALLYHQHWVYVVRVLPFPILYINEKRIKPLQLHFRILKSHSLPVLQKMSRKLGT